MPAVSAQSSDVPDWVKNNAKWWAEGKISDQEYLDAVKFLVDNQIIKVQTFSPLLAESENGFVSTNENVLEAILVQFYRGEFSEKLIIDTFSRFNSGNDLTLLTELRDLGYESYFLLESLPSKDKADFYKIVSKYINTGKKPQRFDVKISGIMTDGSTIISSNHIKCQVAQYSISYQVLTTLYQFTNEKQGEIRDRILFYCGGPQIGDITNSLADEEVDSQKNTDTIPHYIIPDDNDRATSFVVHFFDGELELMHTLNTFNTFVPISDSKATPSSMNPQFYLESLPSKDKKGFYNLLSRYVNPVKVPERFNVSIDLTTADGTILQRWNYVDCKVKDYTAHLEEFKRRYHFSGKDTSEIIDRTDFKCAGLHLQIHGHDKISKFPISARNFEQKLDLKPDFGNFYLTDDVRAIKYELHFFGGEYEKTYSYTNFPKFESLSWGGGPLTPAHHPNQFQYGFLIESNPSKDKSEIYQQLSRYINPGKPPEPFNVNVDVITADGTILYTLKYKKCSAIDFDWYLQEEVNYYGLPNIPQPETRERYTNYCTGFNVEVP